MISFWSGFHSFKYVLYYLLAPICYLSLCMISPFQLTWLPSPRQRPHLPCPTLITLHLARDGRREKGKGTPGRLLGTLQHGLRVITLRTNLVVAATIVVRTDPNHLPVLAQSQRIRKPNPHRARALRRQDQHWLPMTLNSRRSW